MPVFTGMPDYFVNTKFKTHNQLAPRSDASGAIGWEGLPASPARPVGTFGAGAGAESRFGIGIEQTGECVVEIF